MAGARSNTVTYVFEGDTLNLEQAIKRVQSLMRGTVKTLKEQEGGMSEVQKAQYKHLKNLMKVIRELQDKDVLNENEQKRLNSATKEALRISNRLYKAKLKEKDRIRQKAYKKEHKDNLKAEREVEKIEEARTPEAQVRAHSQLAQLSRLRGFMSPTDPAEKEAIENLDAVIAEYNEAKQAYDAGTGSMERLAAATVKLNEKYKELAGSLNRLSSEQNKANRGEGKSSFIQYLLGKAKSLAVYRTLRVLLVKIANAVKEAFSKIAQVNQPFNDAMSRITSSFQLLADKIATVLAPVLQLLVPLFEGIISVIGQVTDAIAEMFSAIAGNDAWAQATYQVEDYAEAVKKTKQSEGLDELNKLNTDNNGIVNVDIDSKFENLKSLGEEIKGIFETITRTITPMLEPLIGVLQSVFQLIGAIATALKPLFNLIVNVVTFVGNALGGVLGFLINGILVPIVNWLGFMIQHLGLLIPLLAAFFLLWAAFNWSQVVLGFKSMILGFVNLGKAIAAAVIKLKTWMVEVVAAKIKSIAMAFANKWEAMTWWQKAAAIIASAGILALVVAGIAMAASSAVASSGQSQLNDNMGQIPAMAAGGIVAAPTIAMVGEGQYPEAVVPLGQSPQFQSMKEGIASEVVRTLGISNQGASKNSDRPVVLQIDGKTIAKALWPNLVDTQYQVGVKLK